MKLSLGQAAKLAGRGKTTLTRAIKAGRLSAARADGGGYLIDVSELARVYELRHDATPETVTRDRHAAHHATPARDPRDPETVARLAELETEVRLLREMLAEVRENREELRADRDEWKGRAERLLTDQRTPAPSPPPRRSAPRPRVPAASEPAATADATPSPSGFIQRAEFEVENGMEKIRRRLEARLAERGH